MKKTFPLHLPDKTDSRVIESIQITLNKYVKRERRKTLPEGTDFWDFNCRVGPTSDAAASLSLGDIPKAIAAVALAEHPDVYVEILAFPGHWPKRAGAEEREHDES